jgi:hypothetical protein
MDNCGRGEDAIAQVPVGARVALVRVRSPSFPAHTPWPWTYDVHSDRKDVTFVAPRAGRERIGDYVGHSSTYMTEAYRHLIEGHEAEAAERFEDYLTRAASSR